MLLRCIKISYVNSFFYFLVTFLIVLFTHTVIFCSTGYTRTLSESVKKYASVPAFATQTEQQSDNILSSVSHYKKKKLLSHSLSESGNGSSLWSNAFNFKKTIDAQADPRTGILSAHIKVGGLLSNEGHGPDIDLEVNYNSGTTADPDELGYGWSWNITHFNPVTNQLTTSTGQNFYLEKNQGRWFPLYHKLQDIRIDGDKRNAFVITYANGLRETLNHNGYETKLQQQNGWSVYFSYVPGTHLLQSITDDKDHSIELHYKNDNVYVINKDALGEPVILIINQSKGEIRGISFQSPQHHIISGIYIRYTGHLITQINYPTGLTKRFYYDCKSAMKIPVPDNFSGYSLCVINKVSVDPGTNQPVMTMHYYYSEADHNKHNYLGFNSGLSLISKSVKDILFEAPLNYTYKTIADNGLVKEIRTYNKYHLLINDKKISVRTGKKLSDVQVFFCRMNDPDGCAHSSFESLPVYYSRPLKIVTRLWNDNATYPAISTETTSYDKYGRTNRYKDAYGRLTVTKYCPQQGDTACPPVPHGWLAGTLTESVTQYPASIKTAAVPPPVTMYNYYHKIPAYTGGGYTMVLDHQIIRAGQQYTAKKYHYHQNHDNPFLYGLLKQTIFTGSTDKASAINLVSKHYYYIKNANHHTKTTYTSVDLKSGKKRLSSSVTTSLFTNQTLQTADATGLNITHYHYDFMGRLIRTDRAVGTPFAVSAYYTYTISPALNQVLITSPNKLQQKTIFDGAGRILMHFNQAVAETGKPVSGRWFPIQRISYDQYGRVLAKHTYIIKRPDIAHEFTTTQNYDDSGRVIRIHLSDNREMITEYDDADRCVVHYEKSSTGKYSAISVVHANILYQPVMNLLLPAPMKPPLSAYNLCHWSVDTMKNQQIKVSVTSYDAFGRVVKITDPLGHIIKKSYDEFGAITDITDPKGDRLHNVYDLSGHRIQSWAYPVSGGHYLLSSAEYNNAGELLWSAGEDKRRSTFTYNKSGQLLKIINPAGHTISLQYNVLGLPVAQSLDGKLQLQLDYDPVTTLIAEKKGITGTTTFIYNADGLIRQLIHSGKNGYTDYKLSWKYDINRRLINVTDITGNQTQTVYDNQGRVEKMIYQPLNNKIETVASSVYDDFSRLKTLHYGSGMDRNLHYDAFGHVLEITDTLHNRLLYDEYFHYDANDNITMLMQKTDQYQYAKLSYHYDALNNLINMTCKGSEGLPLCPRDTYFSGSGLTRAPVITRQDYSFTPLNRLASIQETLQDSATSKAISKKLNYYYADPQVPLRIQQISTTWNHVSTVTQHFDYDVMGNMINDGEKNHLLYNAFNQVTQVNKKDGQHSYYNYDSSGKTVKTVSAEGVRYLFYRGSQLIGEKINSSGQNTHFIGYLGVAKTIDSIIQTYNETNYKGDVVGVLNKERNCSAQYKLNQRNIYSPYGMVFHQTNNSLSLPLHQKTLYGFDGELTDPATGWQFLGNGHRAYNPGMRYFVSEDPAGNGYGFGSNNPVMNSDPSGNMSRWLGTTLKWIGNIMSFGLSALHSKWANIASAVIMTGLTVVSLGATAASCGGAALGAAVAGGTAIYGSVPVIAALVPSNKGLNMAASVIGLTEMAATLATAAVDMGFFLSESLCSPVYSGNVDPDKVNFQMLATFAHKPDGTPRLMQVGEVIKRLKQKAALYIIELDNKPALFFNEIGEVINVWAILKSCDDNPLIVCDSGALLMAAQRNKSPLFLSDFQNFLIKKFGFVFAHICKIKESEIKDRASIFLHTFKSVLNALSNDEKYVDTSEKPLTSFEDVLTKPFQTAIMQHINHISVVERADKDIWYLYGFDVDGSIAKMQGSLSKLKTLFSAAWKELSDVENPLEIYGYIRLPQEDATS